MQRLIWYQYINESNYFMYQCRATDSTYPTHSSSLANYFISMWERLIAKYNGKSVLSGRYTRSFSASDKLSKVQRLAFMVLTFNRIIGVGILDFLMVWFYEKLTYNIDQLVLQSWWILKFFSGLKHWLSEPTTWHLCSIDTIKFIRWRHSQYSWRIWGYHLE